MSDPRTAPTPEQAAYLDKLQGATVGEGDPRLQTVVGKSQTAIRTAILEHMSNDELLSAWGAYCRWAGDDFAIDQPDIHDHTHGSLLRAEILRRMETPDATT